MDLRVPGLIPDQGPVPGLQVRSMALMGAHVGSNQLMCVCVSLSFSTLLLLLSLKINEKNILG